MEQQSPSDPASASGYTRSVVGDVASAPARSNEFYQTIFELMPGSVLLMDTQGIVLEANPSFCQHIGYARKELIGQHVSLFSKDSRETIDANIARLLAGEILEHEVCNIHRDGSTRHYELRETAITWPDGSRRILALSNDITQRVNAEKEKLELQRQFLHAEKLKSLGLMAGGIAHDFNNLLAAVIGNIELGLLDSKNKPPIHELLREALTAANRAAHLTRQMLAYSGRGRFVVTNLDLNGVIRGMEEILNAAVSKKASLELSLAPMLPMVEGDAAQLQQIVVNLVTNASEALEDKPGYISVTTAVRIYDDNFLAASRTGTPLKPGCYVTLEVCDSGCGMDESVQQRLFDPFFSTKFTGRGLGMSAVLGAVRSHEGGIILKSAVNGGTTVSILLPAVGRTSNQSQPVASKVADSNLIPSLTGTVLVADDEAVMRTMVERILKRVGLRVLLATDGAEAVELFRQHAHEITFVLLDLTMPKLDGVNTLAELRRHQPNVKAVLTSGFTEANLNERSTQAGFVEFIAKPYEAKRLIEIAQKICGSAL